MTRAHVGTLFPAGEGNEQTLNERLGLLLLAIVLTAGLAVWNLLQSDGLLASLYAFAGIAALSAVGLQLWLNLAFAAEARPKTLKTLTHRYRAAVTMRFSALTFWLVVSVCGLAEAAGAIVDMSARHQLLDALVQLAGWVMALASTGWLLFWTGIGNIGPQK